MTELERRYRRLLRWFPPAHRETHGEEILGVLLETAEPGRLAGAAPVLHELAWYVANDPPWSPWLIVFQTWVYGAWLPLVWLAYAGLHRTAAVGAWATTLALVWHLRLDLGGDYYGDTAVPVGWILLSALTATALLLSSGPRRGIELLGGRLLWIVAGAGVALVTGAAGNRLLPAHLIALLVLSVVVVATRRPPAWTAGWTVALVLAGFVTGPTGQFPTIAGWAPILAALAVLPATSRRREAPAPT